MSASNGKQIFLLNLFASDEHSEKQILIDSPFWKYDFPKGCGILAAQ